MENEYNYYDPNQEDENDIVDEQPGESYTYYPGPEEEKIKSKKVPSKMKRVIVWAILFGVVASATFSVSNYAIDKVIGYFDNDQGNTSIGSTSNNQETVTLNKTSSTVVSDVSGIVDANMPAVVSITNMSIQEVQSFFGGVQQQESTSCGSGIIVGKNDSELLIVTNNHVVEGAKTLTVTFVDDKSVEGNIKGTDASKDLAVVSVPLESLDQDTTEKIAIITLGDSNSLQVGEPVIAIGNALGYGQSVTSGIVSALNRDLEMEGFDSKLIQTDAAINPGNSGGALLNANGELIGINTVKVNANAVEGMGYAIPISDASDVIENLMNRVTRAKVSEEERGYLGIQGRTVTAESTKMYNIPTGVYVVEVLKGSGAADAKLSKGCIITKLDGITIDSMSTLQEQLSYYKAGEEVEVVIKVPENDGEYSEKTVTVTLGKATD